MDDAPCPLPYPGAPSVLTRGCFSHQVFTLWDANEPFLGTRNPRELVLQSTTADCQGDITQSPGPAGWLPWNDDGWKSPAWNRDPPPALGQRLGAEMAACTSLPARSPGCQRLWEPEHRTGMVTQSTRDCGMVYSVSVLWSSWGHVDAGVCFIRACQESWPWGSAGSMQPLMAQPGVPGTLTRSSRVSASAILPVQRVQCRDRCGEQQHICSARGCNGSGVWDDPEMAAPGAALPGNGYTVPGRSK